MIKRFHSSNHEPSNRHKTFSAVKIFKFMIPSFLTPAHPLVVDACEWRRILICDAFLFFFFFMVHLMAIGLYSKILLLNAI